MASWPVLDRVARVWAAEPRALVAVQRAVSLSACAMAVALTRLPDGRHDDESDDLTTSLYSVNKTQHFYSYQVTTSRTTVWQTGHLPSLWKGTLCLTSLNVSNVHAFLPVQMRQFAHTQRYPQDP